MEGARAYYSCDQEYKLADESADVLKCGHTKWIGKRPECLPKMNNDNRCTEPSPFENGYEMRFP